MSARPAATPAAFEPPARAGVSPSRLVVGPGPWTTVAGFLAARLRPGIDWAARLAAGDVVDALGRPLAAQAPCHAGQVLWYWRHLEDEAPVPFDFELLHHDEHLVVVDKPHFLAAIPGGRHLQETVLVRLRRQLGRDELVALHRLDRDTAGLLMFSAHPATRGAYHALVREQRLHKVYEAVAPWRPALPLPFTARHRLHEARGERHLPVQVVPGEPNAQVELALIARLGRPAWPGEAAPATDDELAHYRLTPATGRRHQLRVQLCALGLPIVGDRVYPRFWPEPPAGAPPDHTRPLQLLARALAFTDPVSGEARCFTSRRVLALARPPSTRPA